MTVEAAMILPLFLFFFLQMAGFLEMLRLHSNLEYGMWKAGKALMFYGAAEDIAEKVPDVAVSYGYVNNVIRDTLGADYLEHSPLRYGSKGLNFLRSDIINEADEVELVLTYQVRPGGGLLSFPYVRMANAFYGRAWTGYDVTADAAEEKWAYITRYGEVWHASEDCAYLRRSIEAVGREQIKGQRNKWGKRYEPCMLCAEDAKTRTVYITKAGECFHEREECPALKRYIISIRWEKREQYRACSRCADG